MGRAAHEQPAARSAGLGAEMTERLSGLDSSFLYLETPTLHMHVVMALVLDPATIDGGYSYPEFRHLISERIALAPVFKRRLMEVPLRLGHPVWVDDADFDVDNHVRRAALPSPGGIRELAELVADVASRQLRRDRPLWEMWVVEGFEGDKLALIAKVHHATVDGVSGAELLGVVLDIERTPPHRAISPQPGPPRRVPSSAELVSQSLVAHAVRPIEIARMAWRTGRAVLDVRRIRQRGTGKAALPLTAPRTSLNTAVTARRRVAFAATSLEDAKRLKNELGTTVNDVVLAVCTGALRRYLLAGDELPDGPLVAVVPVSVAPDVPDLKGSNKVSALFVTLPTHMQNPIDRVRFIHEGTKGAKSEHNALGANMLQNWVEHASPNVFALAARLYTAMRLAERHRPIANLVISNVPGPDFPLYLGGAELEAAFPLGPVMDGMGLNITIMSYRGVLYWGLIGSTRNEPRMWDLAAAIPDALTELATATGIEPQPFDARLTFAAVPEDEMNAGAVREPAET